MKLSNSTLNIARKLRFESLEDRLPPSGNPISYTVPYEASSTFDQFTGGAPLAVGFGVNDPIANAAGLVDPTPGFLGVQFDQDWSTYYNVLVGDGRVGLDFDGRFGIEYGYYLNGGTATVERSGDVTLTVDEDVDGALIDVGVSNLDGYLYTIAPKISAYADLVMKLRANLYGNFDGLWPIPDYTFNENLININERLNLFSINRQTGLAANNTPLFDGEIKYIGQNVMPGIASAATELKDAYDQERNAEIKQAQAEREQRQADTPAEVDAAKQKKQQAANDLADARNRQQQIDDDSKDHNNNQISAGALTLEFGEAEGSLLGAQLNVGIGGGFGPISASRSLGSLAVTMPDINLTDLSVDPEGRLGADTDDFADDPALAELEERRQLANLKLDIASLLGGSFGLGKLSFSFLDVLNVNLTTLSYELTAALNVNQGVEVVPSAQTMSFQFLNDATGLPISVNARLDGVLHTNITSLNFRPGQQLELIPLGTNAVRVVPTYQEDYAFTNDIGLDLGFSGRLEALAFKADILGYEIIDIPPLITRDSDFGGIDLGSIYKRSFNINPAVVTLDSFVIGGIKTDLQASISTATTYINKDDATTYAVTYNVALTNLGPDTATVARVNFTIPAGMTLVPAGTTAGYTLNGNVVSYQRTSIASGTSRNVTIKVTATSPEYGDAYDSIVDVNGDDRDLEPDNDTTLLTTYVQGAKTYFVTQFGDSAPGTPWNFGDLMTLRQAIELANSSPGLDFIRIGTGLSQHQASLTHGELIITDSVTVLGNFNIYRFDDPNNRHRLVQLGGAGANKYTFVNTWFWKGDVDGSGAAIYLADNNDHLVLRNTVFHDNHARNGGYGGAIYVNGADLTVRNSGFVNNTSDGYGGAIQIESSNHSTVFISNSVFAKNVAEISGGAIDLSSYGTTSKITATITDSVFADNRATDQGAAIDLYDEGDPVALHLTRSIFARNAGAGNVEGFNSADIAAVTSGGANLSDDPTGPLSGAGDRQNTDAELSELNFRIDFRALPYYDVYDHSQAADLNGKALKVVTDTRSDLEALSFTTNHALTELRLRYRVNLFDASEFRVQFYISNDSRTLQNASRIGNGIVVQLPSDRTMGEHEITITDPAIINAIMNRDYRFIVAVLDGDYQVAERVESNNLVPFVGALHTGHLMVRGSDAAGGSGQFTDETIHLDVQGGLLTVRHNEDESAAFPPNAITGITILSNAGNDHITISPLITASAFVDAGPGQDHIAAGNGNDTLFGGSGNDTMFGGEGNDLMWGRFGLDPITGLPRPSDGTASRDNDSMFGHAGNDTMYGEVGRDVMSGNEGRDHLEGMNGHDTLYGNAGADSLFGGAGDDHLAGADETSNDRVYDVLVGNEGNDQVVGAYDALDRLTGAFRTAAEIETEARPMITKVLAPEAGTYGTKDALTFTVEFGQEVTVVGMPRLQVTIGSSKYYANYAGIVANSNRQHAFNLNVPKNRVDSNGIALRASIIVPKGSSIKDATGAAVNLNFTPPRLAGVKVDSRLPKVTSIKPTSFDANTRIATFVVNFTSAVAGVTNDDFDIVQTGTLGSSTVQNVTTNGKQVVVQVLVGAGSGTVRLRLQDDNTITDLAGNALGGEGIDNGDFLRGSLLKVL